MKKSALLFAVTAALISLSANAEVDAKAAKMFKSKCAACHGAAGKGDTDMGKKLKVPDFSAGLKDSDADLKIVIKDGKLGAKAIEDHAFGEKVGDQLDNVVAVVRSFKK